MAQPWPGWVHLLLHTELGLGLTRRTSCLTCSIFRCEGNPGTCSAIVMRGTASGRALLLCLRRHHRTTVIMGERHIAGLPLAYSRPRHAMVRIVSAVSRGTAQAGTSHEVCNYGGHKIIQNLHQLAGNSCIETDYAESCFTTLTISTYLWLSTLLL